MEMADRAFAARLLVIPLAKLVAASKRRLSRLARYQRARVRASRTPSKVYGPNVN
jgi:hypothetical protein